jgi:hypothetical protein
MLKVRTASVACAAVLISASVLTACSSTGTQVAAVRGGAVNLKQVRVGTPGNIFQEAAVTFVPDPNGAVSGKIQYLSRLEDNDGSQFVVQVKDDQCYEIDLINRNKQLSRDAAIAKMQNLLPPSVVASGQPVVKPVPGQQAESFTWNDKFRGELQYTDGSQKSVNMISAARLGVPF